MTVPAITLTEPTGPNHAPLVVLGHSLGTGPLIWERAAPLLSEDFRVTLLSLPGHGAAPVPGAPFTMAELGDAVANAVRHLTAGTPTFYAGVSIGGALALQLALDHPDVFAAAASLAAGAELGTREHWEARAAIVRQQSTSVLIAPSSRSWFAPESFEREPVLIGRILHALRDTDDEGYARCAEALAGYDLRARLGEIRVPLLALWGELDTVGTEARQDEIVAGANRDGGRRARKVRIDGIAHQPPAERPDATAEALREFFEGIPA